MFRTMDGSILPNLSFAQGQPDSAEHLCVVRDVEHSEWKTIACRDPAKFVCQKDVAVKGEASV